MELLEKIILRYCLTPDSKSQDNAQLIHLNKQKQVPIRLRVLKLIHYWVESNFETDFKFDQNLVKVLMDFLENTASISSFTLSLKTLLTNKLNGTAVRKTIQTKIIDPPDPIMPLAFETLTVSSLTFLQIDPLEIARQLSMIEQKIYRSINPSELLNMAWQKKDKEIISPNIVALTKIFNKISNWVYAEILMQEDSVMRVNTLKNFILIADHARKLNNFNSMMEIIAGIGNSSIHRLKRTWIDMDEPSLKLLENMKLIMANNYKKFRESITQVNPPCLPYIGIYLTDLTFIEEGNRNKIGDLINCSKLRLIAQVVNTIQLFQQESYHFREIPLIRDWILSREGMGEDEAYRRSLSVESKKLHKLIG